MKNDKDIKIALVCCRPPDQARGFSSLPLGILYIGTVLKKRGYKNVYLLDHSFNSFEKIISQINWLKPDIVGLNAMSAYFLSAKRIGQHIKENLSSTVVLGGPHASIMTDDEFLSEDWIDFLVRGEGEVSFEEIIKEYKNPSQIRGSVFQDERNNRFIIEAEKIHNLDEIPFPDLNLLSTASLYLDRRRYGLLGSRGCPFSCTYCQPGLSKIWGRGVRFRSPENIVEEIRLIKRKYGINDISFLDDTFTLNEVRLKKLLSLLEKENIVFDINARVDCFSEEIAKALKRAGCERISFGLESGDSKILNEDFRKNIKIDQMRQAFKLCHRVGIETKAYLIMGSISETPETLKKTEKLIDEIKPDLLSFSIATPFKGTYFYEMCQEKGLLDFSSYQQLDFRSFLSKELPIRNYTLTFYDLEKWKDRILKKRRLKFIVKYSWKIFIGFIKKPSINYLLRCYKDFRTLNYIG